LDHPQGGSEHTLGGMDEEFITNVYYAASAEIVAETAAVLGYDLVQVLEKQSMNFGTETKGSSKLNSQYFT